MSERAKSRRAQDPLATLILVVALSLASAGILVYLTRPDPPQPIVILDLVKLVDSLPEGATTAEMAAKIKQAEALSDEYARAGYLVLDKKAVIASPEGLDISIRTGKQP